MNKKILTDTVSRLLAGNKGLLAMDESNPTCNKRFEVLHIPQTVEYRRNWRELLVNTPGLGECIGGAILYDETIRQNQRDGTPIVKTIIDKGIIPGIKVDKGAKLMAGHPGEKVTEGLDGLRERLQEYFQMGARFAKWRAVITIGEEIPSRACIEANANILALYAGLCQEAGLVPIVEPEVLMDGSHDLQTCFTVTEEVLRTVFASIYLQKLMPEGLILKPNMVISGLNCLKQASIVEVADATIQCLFEIRSCCCRRHCLLVRRSVRRTRLGSSKCHASAVCIPTSMAVGIFVCTGYPATCHGDLGRERRKYRGGTAGFVASCKMR